MHLNYRGPERKCQNIGDISPVVGAEVRCKVSTGGLWCVQGQLIGVALSFLRNFGIFSGASGVLGALSRGVAAIGTDQATQEVLSLLTQLSRVLFI